MVTTAVRVKDTDKIGPEAGARGTAWAAVHIEVHTMAQRDGHIVHTACIAGV